MDNSYYEQAVKAFNEQEYLLALQHVNQFNKDNMFKNMQHLPHEYSFFEILVNYQLGLKGDKSYFHNAIILGEHYLAAHGVDKTEKNELIRQQTLIVLTLMGECFCNVDNRGSAIKAYEYAINLDPEKKDRNVWFKLFSLYAKEVMGELTRELAIDILTWQEFVIPAHLFLLGLARSEQNKALALAEINILENKFALLDEAQVNLLIQHTLKIGEVDKAEKFISRVSSNNICSAQYAESLARVYFAKKEYKKSIELIEEYGQENSKKGSLALGKAYDKLGEFDKAFNAYTVSSEIQETEAQEFFKIRGKIDYPERYKNVDLDNLNKKKINIQSAFSSERKKNNAPIFLLGFNRSGTTLLDSILDTQPSLVTLSESPSVASAFSFMKTFLSKQYPEEISSLSTSDLERIKEAYDEMVKRFLPLENNIKGGHKLIIDKMPLHTLHIPFILTLFPNAKFIFSLRHPMDCVLSNFQQNYNQNAETSFLTTLKLCTKRYIEVFTHFERCQQAFDLDIHFIKYEDLVLNIEEEAKKVFEFIGLQNIDPSYLQFHNIAKNKVIKTASSGQVNQPLYTSSMYKWKNYEHHLTAELKALEHFIDKFGYKE